MSPLKIPQKFRAPKFVPADKFYKKLIKGLFVTNVILPLGFLCKAPILKWFFRPFFIKFLDQGGLFNEAWYLEHYPDVVGTGISPKLHFLMYGDREGRLPMPLFEPHFYRAQLEILPWSINSLLHYHHLGWLLRIAPSPSFDIKFYLNQSKDVSFSLIEPLKHYSLYGGAEGRSPNPKFDGLYYLKTYKEVLDMSITPLEHFLFYGKSIGYLPNQMYEKRNPLVSKLPSGLTRKKLRREVIIDGLKSYKFKSPYKVDVIIPVYKGYESTLRAISSAINSAKHSQTAFEIIVINDASPDLKLEKTLIKLAKSGLFTYLKNAHNLGFVGTVNRGMKLHPDRDVVLLNSDTQVFRNWVDRLRDASLIQEHIASVTPFSNNATICSYPDFLEENPLHLEIGWSDLDKLTSKLNHQQVIQLPTGHGFCLYLKRNAIKAVGLFDDQAFGKGYGEENDWCVRASKSGWINILALDTFVYHEGSVSFGQEKRLLIAEGLKVIGERYPDYSSSVSAFIKADPVKIFRERLDWGRLQSQVKEKNVLMVCHSRGGGAERHLQEDTQRMLEAGIGVFYLRPDPLNKSYVLIESPLSGSHSNIQPFLFSNTSDLSMELGKLKITSIHDHGLVDFNYHADESLSRLVKELNVEFLKEIHDYKVICPRLNLVNDKGVYCHEAQPYECNRCINKKSNIYQASNIQEWRHMQYQSLKLADKIFVPDVDVAERLSRYFSDLEFEISPHADLRPRPIKNFSPIKNADKNIEVMVIGAIGDIKGFNVLLDCAIHAKKNRLPITFKVMGYSKNDEVLRNAGVKILGRYNDELAVQLCRKYNPDIVWLPSIWPETYSYTLDIALKAGMPVMAFDIGAISRRLFEFKTYPSLIIPLELMGNPAKINQFLCNKFKIY